MSGIQDREAMPPKKLLILSVWGGALADFSRQWKYAAYDAFTKKGDENAKKAFRFQGQGLTAVNGEIMTAGISSKYDALITQINQKVDWKNMA